VEELERKQACLEEENRIIREKLENENISQRLKIKFIFCTYFQSQKHFDNDSL